MSSCSFSRDCYCKPWTAASRKHGQEEATTGEKKAVLFARYQCPPWRSSGWVVVYKIHYYNWDRFFSTRWLVWLLALECAIGNSVAYTDQLNYSPRSAYKLKSLFSYNCEWNGSRPAATLLHVPLAAQLPPTLLIHALVKPLTPATCSKILQI